MRARQRLTTARSLRIRIRSSSRRQGSCVHSSLRILCAARHHHGGILGANAVEGAAETPQQRLPRAASPRRLEDHRTGRPDAIRSLKDEVGDLYLSGSGTLVRAMPADGLIDELPLFGYPSR